MSKRVLITGATGFVGSHILEAFMQDASVTIIVACRDKNKLLKNFTGEVRVGDLRDSNYVEGVVKDIDIICHAAAWTSLWSNEGLSKVNFLDPTLRLIKAAKNTGVTQFIFPSTTSAASPNDSSNPLSKGVARKFWPHLCNVIAIEDELRNSANASFSTVILRLGIFTGRRYGVGVLPILLPRLKTHLVPWVASGKTHIPLIDGRDIARAFVQTVQTIKAKTLANHEAFNIVGTEQPTVRELILFIHEKFNYPKPHFGVPFSIAYPFAWLMEKIDAVVPWEPLITRSIIHLLEETHVDNEKASEILDYKPVIYWKNSVTEQINELHSIQKKPMSMVVVNTKAK